MNKIQFSLTDEFINEIASGNVSDAECESAAQHLRNYKLSLDAQTVPVEPDLVKNFRREGYGPFDLINSYDAKKVVAYIDSRQSALKLAQEERDRHMGAVQAYIEDAEAMKKRAEKAEALAEQNRKAIDQAARVMRGEGVNDLGEAWDKCLQILDAAIDSARAE